MKLYICSIEGLADAASFDAASLKIDSYRKEKLDRIKSEQDRMRSMCAGLLLNYAVAEYRLESGQEEKTYDGIVQEISLQELLNTEKQVYEYKQQGNGKPYIVDMSDFYFSISHSGEYVLCACDSHEIGADLQCMNRKVKDVLAKKVMTENEYKKYLELSVQEQLLEFYRVWTIKESYCKLTGEGLSMDFRTVEIDKISYQVSKWKENYWLAVSHYE